MAQALLVALIAGAGPFLTGVASLIAAIRAPQASAASSDNVTDTVRGVSVGAFRWAMAGLFCLAASTGVVSYLVISSQGKAELHGERGPQGAQGAIGGRGPQGIPGPVGPAAALPEGSQRALDAMLKSAMICADIDLFAIDASRQRALFGPSIQLAKQGQFFSLGPIDKFPNPGTSLSEIAKRDLNYSYNLDIYPKKDQDDLPDEIRVRLRTQVLDREMNEVATALDEACKLSRRDVADLARSMHPAK